jgi:hypothetical protein
VVDPVAPVPLGAIERAIGAASGIRVSTEF